MEEGLRAGLAAGDIDERLVEAFRTAARTATRARPAPTGAPRWSDEDIDDLVFDTVTRVTTAKLVLAAEQAASDAQLMQWLRATVRTTLDLTARRTPSGRVMRSMDDALREEPSQFVLADGQWRLASDDRPPAWGAGIAELVREAWTVTTKLVRQSENAEKTPPMAHRGDIRVVSEAVLRVAGPLPKAVLAEVLAARFNALFGARFDYIDQDPGSETDPAAPDAPGAFEEVDDRLAAQWMLTQLTSDERRVLGVVVSGGGVRAVASELGCGKEKASAVTKRLEAKLRRLAELSGGDTQEATLLLLHLVGQEEILRHSLGHDGHADVH